MLKIGRKLYTDTSTTVPLAQVKAEYWTGHLSQDKHLYTCINAHMHTYRDRGHLTLKTAQLLQIYSHTHTLTTLNTSQSILVSPVCLPCSSIVIWQSATTLRSLCFWPLNPETALFLWGLIAFHWRGGKKRPFTTKTFTWEKCGDRRIRTSEWPLLMW